MAAHAKAVRWGCVTAAALAMLAVGRSSARGQVVSAAEDPSLASETQTVAVAMPTTEPAASNSAANDREGHHDFHPGWFNGGWNGGMGGSGDLQETPDAGEWKQISTFMIDHSPRRWAFYQRLPEGNRQRVMMRVATKAFRNLQKAQSDDPKLAAVIVQSVEAQDAVFGIAMDLRQARRDGDTGKVDGLAHDLREKVASLVDLSFKERQLRVDALQRTVEDLKTQLARDQQNRDSVIEERMRAVIGGAHVAMPVTASPESSNAAPTMSPAN